MPRANGLAAAARSRLTWHAPYAACECVRDAQSARGVTDDRGRLLQKLNGQGLVPAGSVPFRLLRLARCVANIA